MTRTAAYDTAFTLAGLAFALLALSCIAPIALNPAVVSRAACFTFGLASSAALALAAGWFFAVGKHNEPAI